MKIIDLTGSYIRHVLKNGDLATYEQTMPELFNHYFTFWGARESFRPPLLDEASVEAKRILIQSRLPEIEWRASEIGRDISDLAIVLFVGRQSTNGHAFRYQGKFVVWLPVESYNTTQEVDIFVTHEVIHALHYATTPDFYFETGAEKNNMLRQLITEGIATDLSMSVWNADEATALWAGSISTKAAQDWMAQCASRLNELCRFSLAHINESPAGFFQANDSNDIFNYRAGYYVGLEIIKRVAHRMRFTPTQLLQVSKKEWEELVLQELQQCE